MENKSNNQIIELINNHDESLNLKYEIVTEILKNLDETNLNDLILSLIDSDESEFIENYIISDYIEIFRENIIKTILKFNEIESKNKKLSNWFLKL